MLSKEAMNIEKTRCRFQNFGFCTFRDKCNFKHVHNVFQKQVCDLQNCSARHSKKCKYFAKKKCKFGEKCHFSHKANHISSESEIKQIEEEFQCLKVENKRLEEERKEKEKEQDKVNLKLNNTREELLETKKKLNISQDINVKLLKDIQDINDKLMVFVPGIEKENEELKETLAMLHAVIDIYKQAETDGEIDEIDIENDDNDGYQASSGELFQCG